LIASGGLPPRLWTGGLIAWLMLPSAVGAQAINYDRLSFFNAPLAYTGEAGTVSLNALLDVSYQSENDGDATFRDVQGVARLLYQDQLRNDWDIGASIEVDYQEERAEQTIDIFQAFVRDQWGEVVAGNIAREVYDRSRRQQGAGLLDIDNDNFTLTLDEYGGFYQWSTPDTGLMVAFDTEASIESGLTYRKPVGSIDYRATLRVSVSDPDEVSAQGVDSGEGVALVMQARRGRWLADVQYLKERLNLIDGNSSFDLVALSAGLHYAFNRLRLSLTALSRENTLDNTERTIALGARFDVSRGLSVNLGFRQFDSRLFPEDLRSYAISLRYEL